MRSSLGHFLLQRCKNGRYPILTFSEVPKVDIELIDRPNEPPTGAGEAACTPVGAALANAIFDATGVRLRTIPFTAENVDAAWGKSS
jgi:nicotinate dehydrogenase subunit B